MLVYPSSMQVSNRAALQTLADALRHHRTILGSRWRRLPAGRQALLVLAHLNKGETYTALASGFGVGTTTVFRYVREGVDVLAATAPTLDEALDLARGKAFVILDGTLLPIDRVAMASGHDRAFYSGKHKRHGVNGAGPGRPGWPAGVGLTRAAGRTARPGRRPRARPHRRAQRRRGPGRRRYRLSGRRPGDPGAAASAPARCRRRPISAALSRAEGGQRRARAPARAG